MGKLKYADRTPVDPKLRALLIEGSEDAAGLLMLVAETPLGAFAWDNDGLVEPLAGTFEEAVAIGMESGFAFMWRRPGHPISTAARERLSQSAAPKITHRVHVTSVAASSAQAFRDAFGRTLSSHIFDSAMKLAKVKASHAGLSEEDRGKRFAEAFSRADVAPAAGLLKLGLIDRLAYPIEPAARTIELLADRLRMDERPTVRIEYRIEPVASGLPPDLGDRLGAERVLASVAAFRGLAQAWGDELELLRFSPGAAGPTRLPTIQNTTVTQDKKVHQLVGFLDAEAAAGIEAGSYDASALAPGLAIG